MDEFSSIAQVFGNGFFPVIMCVLLVVAGYKVFMYLVKEGKSVVEKIEAKNAEYNDKLSEVIKNNTTAVLSIKDGLKDVENRLQDVEEKVDRIYDKGDDRR